jgi:imidazoleglycerol phosphate dehydratase HisB
LTETATAWFSWKWIQDFTREEHAMAEDLRMALVELLRKAGEDDTDFLRAGYAPWPMR